MDNFKTKSMRNIEQKMELFEEGSVRYQALESAKNFKSSWIELGRSLYSVWRDKLYKEWGYSDFDLYTTKEIGIRKDTAMKLLRSYYFLEKEEPMYLAKDYVEKSEAVKVPSFESIDVLRQAKAKKSLDEEDYQNLKKYIFEKGKDAKEVKKDLISLIKQRQELEPQEAHEKRRLATIKRFLGTLKALRQEMEISKLVPAQVLKEITILINKVETQIK